MRKRGKTIKIKSLAKEANLTQENFESKLALFLNTANRNFTVKDAREFLIQFFKDSEKEIDKVPDKDLVSFTTLAYTVKYLLDNEISIDYHEHTKQWIEKEFSKLLEVSSVKSTREPSDKKHDVQKFIWQACQDKIGECDNAFDEILETGKTDFNVLEYLKSLEISPLHLRKIYNHYQENFEEIRKALKAKKTKKFYEYNDKGFIGEPDEDKDLNESYRFITESKLKKVIDVYDKILLELDNYIKLNGIKKPRKPKKVNVKKLVSNVKYLRKSEEFEVTSLSPDKIFGSKLVLLFNVKYKRLTVLVSDKGMSVKGTSIYDFNEEKSFTKTVKLKNTLEKFVNNDKKVILEEFNKLTSKPIKGNGRLGIDTLILNCLK